MENSYAILARKSAIEDTPPDGFVARLARRRPDAVDPGSVRLAQRAQHIDLYLYRRGADKICLLAIDAPDELGNSDKGIWCNLASAPMVLGGQDSAWGSFVVGAVPDGVSAIELDGRTILPVGNSFVAQVTSQPTATSTVVLHYKDGSSRSIDLGSGGGAGSAVTFRS